MTGRSRGTWPHIGTPGSPATPACGSAQQPCHRPPTSSVLPGLTPKLSPASSCQVGPGSPLPVPPRDALSQAGPRGLTASRSFFLGTVVAVGAETSPCRVQKDCLTCWPSGRPPLLPPDGDRAPCFLPRTVCGRSCPLLETGLGILGGWWGVGGGDVLFQVTQPGRLGGSLPCTLDRKQWGLPSPPGPGSELANPGFAVPRLLPFPLAWGFPRYPPLPPAQGLQSMRASG